jgi:hypothetical protein
MIDFLDLTPFEALFTHVDDITHEQLTLAVDRLSTYLVSSGHEIVYIPITDEDSNYLRTHRGVDLERIRTMSDSALLTPLIFCQLPNSEYLLVDGTHRYIRHSELRSAHAPAYVVSREIWLDYSITNAPKVSESFLLQADKRA